eukprot:jgi/Botrbrau1/7654/Bobra.0159s0096.1
MILLSQQYSALQVCGHLDTCVVVLLFKHSQHSQPFSKNHLPLLQGCSFFSASISALEAARCSVVVRGCTAGAPTRTFVKGSPEVVRCLVEPSSVPPNFDTVLDSLAQEGYRVLAMAASNAWERPWALGMSRREAEQALSFQGFAIMVNALRSDSKATIQALQEVNVRTIMVTGDHVRTAVSVAHECGMMEECPVCIIDAEDGPSGSRHVFTLAGHGERAQAVPKSYAAPAILQGQITCAVTGRGFQHLLKEPGRAMLDIALDQAAVWARMAPDQKHHLVELLSERGRAGRTSRRHVAFCGDGANDVGALKAAEVGVSLCDAEASVAAPLTSKTASIACLLPVMYEGRASLEAAYAIFSFIIAYAFIQLVAANVMYSYGLNLSMWQYLIQDMLVCMLLGFLMGYTPSRGRLSPERPAERVLSLRVLIPVFAQLALVAASMGMAIQVLKRQPGYQVYQPPPGRHFFSTSDAPENSVVSLMAFAQLLATAAVFNRGSVHRKPFWDNPSLSTALASELLVLLYLVLSPGSAVTRWIRGTADLPFSLRNQLALLMLLYFASAFAVDTLLTVAVSKFKHCKSVSRGRSTCLPVRVSHLKSWELAQMDTFDWNGTPWGGNVNFVFCVFKMHDPAPARPEIMMALPRVERSQLARSPLGSVNQDPPSGIDKPRSTRKRPGTRLLSPATPAEILMYHHCSACTNEAT